MRPKTSFDLWAETGEDITVSVAAVKTRLENIENQVAAMSGDHGSLALADLNKTAAQLMLELEQDENAWHRAFTLLPQYVDAGRWEDAIEVCDTLFRAEQPRSLAALGHGVWLAVTFPVDLVLTLTMLQYVIDETPDDSDGAAVAAATAAYVCDLRQHLAEDSTLELQTMEMLTSVARRHSGIDGKNDFEQWMEKLELNNPEKFLVRLRNIIDVLVQDDWWIDRDRLQAQLPRDDQP
jgi:hypothetical protein